MSNFIQAKPTNLLGLTSPAPRQNALTGVANATFRNSYTGNVIPNVTFPTVTTNNRTGFQGESVSFSPISKIGEAISNIAAFNFQKDLQKRAYDQELKLATLKNESSTSILNSKPFQIASLGIVLLIGAMVLSK